MDNSYNHYQPRIFVSHGKEDSWVARQIARRVQECGATTFLDESDIAKGDDFKNYEDIKKRVNLMPDPAKLVMKRILSEIAGKEKHKIFAR